nr:hemerythrin domain-containing protein [Acidobacteriota bacterium]
HIERAEAAARSALPPPPAFFGSIGNPIRHMLADHDDAGALLKQIRDRSRNFEVPGDGCASYRALYQGLEEFEKDLHAHVHLENNILFPRALEMEKTAGA